MAIDINNFIQCNEHPSGRSHYSYVFVFDVSTKKQIAQVGMFAGYNPMGGRKRGNDRDDALGAASIAGQGTSGGGGGGGGGERGGNASRR